MIIIIIMIIIITKIIIIMILSLFNGGYILRYILKYKENNLI